jgi:hypothetical protein
MYIHFDIFEKKKIKAMDRYYNPFIALSLRFTYIS